MKTNVQTLQIKFRVRKRDTKEFVGYECLMPDIKNNSFMWARSYDGTNWEDGVYNDNYYIREQFTGWKDKNKKEVYVGDVVSCEGGYENYDGNTPECEDIRLVEWSQEGTLQFVASCKNCMVDTPLYEFDISEVIGNISQNPELLA